MSSIVGGEQDRRHTSVGVLTTSSGVCTTTLIGQRTALTAAHCLDGAKWARVQLGASGDVRFSPFFEVERRLKHPSYDRTTGYADLAVLVLGGAPANTAEPASLTTRPPGVGQSVELVGYGVSGASRSDFGVRRTASSEIDVVQRARFAFLVGTSEQPVSFCSGDSGGPSFAAVDGALRIVGVHSFNLRGCKKDGWDSRVDAFASWIHEAAEGDALFDGSYDAPVGGGVTGEDEGGCAMGRPRPGDGPSGLGLLLFLVLLIRYRAGRANA